MLNKAMLLGRVGKDPEVRTTQNGGKVVNFSLATSESWKDRNGEWQEKTQWHNIVVWNEGAAKYVENNVKKGDLIYLEGQIETRKWQDQSGNDRYTTEVVLQPYKSTIQKVPQGGKSGGRDDRDDDRGRDRRDDRRSRDDDRRGGGGYSRDLDDEIPF